MKRLCKIAATLLLVIALLLGVRLFHLGPFGVRPGDDVVLARFTVKNGVRLFIVAHRTRSVIEPYEVTLYRTEKNGDVFTYWMGYEDSFWWACSIRPSDSPSDLHIRADGFVAAIYHVEDHSLTFVSDHHHYGVQTGRAAESNAVPLVVAQMETN